MDIIEASPADSEKMESTEVIADQQTPRNAAAKRMLAAELLAQGITEEAVCRILNISSDSLPKEMVP
jgi:hypothetical protein